MRSDNGAARVGWSISLYAAGGLAGGVVGFLALPFFTRIFTPEEFGVIGLFTAGVALLAPALAVGGHVFVLFDPKRHKDPAGVQGASVLLSLAAAGLLLLAGIGLWLMDVLRGDTLVVAGLALATAWFNTLVLLRRHTFQADQKPRQFFWLSAIPPIAALFLTLALAAAVDGWAPRLVSLLAVAVLTGAWSVVSMRRENRLSIRIGRQRVGDVLRFGAPLIVNTASVWIVGFTDRFIVAERIGLAAAGVYTVAYSLALGVSSLHEGVSRFFASRLPNWVESAQGRVKAARFAYGYVVAALVSVGLFIPLAFVALNLLATDEFAAGSDLLVWLIPAQTLAAIARVFTGYLFVESRTRSRALLSIGEALVNIALTWTLVGAYGVTGAAIATLLTYTISMVGTYALVRNGTALVPFRDMRRQFLVRGQ